VPDDVRHAFQFAVHTNSAYRLCAVACAVACVRCMLIESVSCVCVKRAKWCRPTLRRCRCRCAWRWTGSRSSARCWRTPGRPPSTRWPPPPANSTRPWSGCPRPS
jgi:hypothetical protein